MTLLTLRFFLFQHVGVKLYNFCICIKNHLKIEATATAFELRMQVEIDELEEKRRH